MTSIDIRHGDCLEVLRSMEDNSVDSVTTDPPYGLSNTKPAQVADVLAAWVTGETEAVPAKKGGFMGKDWDSFVPPPAVWAECLRVLKPGGHMAVFAGARTQDLMGLSIRLAGFEIRDTLGWIYGSGFPKSMDVAKAIDRTQTVKVHRRCGEQVTEDPNKVSLYSYDTGEKTGYVAACLECDEDLFHGEIEEVLASELRKVTGQGHAGAGFNAVKGFGAGTTTRGDVRSSQTWEETEAFSPAARQWSGWGTALKPAIEPIILARKPLDGTVAANVLAHGVGGLNIDASRVGSDGGTAAINFGETRGEMYGGGKGKPTNEIGKIGKGRFPANVLLDEHAAKEMDEQSGWQKDGTAVNRNRSHDATPPGFDGGFRSVDRDDRTFGSGGGASRFFPVFKYQAKAPKKERPVIVREDGTKVQHPTVKPVALMSWLVTLITPEGGTTLDPFAGTGTTLQAARDKGFAAIGVEQDEDYIALIEQRLSA